LSSRRCSTHRRAFSSNAPSAGLSYSWPACYLKLGSRCMSVHNLSLSVGNQMNKSKQRMPRSDALVLFGVTGDLAHKMIFPALYALARRGALAVPVIGVAYSNWSLAQLRKRAEDGIRTAGRIDDRRALRYLLSLLRYVDGDYNDPGTFRTLKQALSAARRPAH